MNNIAWAAGRWTTPPLHHETKDDGLHVTARENSDAWRITSYGFIHDSEHALLAGVFIRTDENNWIKAGIEWSDGEESLGAVVTRGVSDWSLSPTPGWGGRLVTVRASRSGDAVTIRARVDDEPWRLVRVAPLDPDAAVSAGPFCCAPTRSGLTVHFTSWRTTPPDASLHPES